MVIAFSQREGGIPTSPVAGEYLLVHLSLEKRNEIWEGSGKICRTISAAYSQPVGCCPHKPGKRKDKKKKKKCERRQRTKARGRGLGIST